MLFELSPLRRLITFTKHTVVFNNANAVVFGTIPKPALFIVKQAGKPVVQQTVVARKPFYAVPGLAVAKFVQTITGSGYPKGTKIVL